MLEKRDFALLRKMFGELLVENNKILRQEMSDMTVNLRDEMHAMENRLIRRMDTRMEQLRSDIVSDIGSIIDDGILQQIIPASMQRSAVD